MKGYTHSGIFHADDVMAAAWLIAVGVVNEVIRVMRLPEDATGVVFDIGGVSNGIDRFDHHQSDAPVAEDGHKLSAFGQIVRARVGVGEGSVWARLCDDPTFQKFVRSIDMIDNGEAPPEWVEGGQTTFSGLISALNPEDRATSDTRFKWVVDQMVDFIQCWVEAGEVAEEWSVEADWESLPLFKATAPEIVERLKCHTPFGPHTAAFVAALDDRFPWKSFVGAVLLEMEARHSKIAAMKEHILHGERLRDGRALILAEVGPWQEALFSLYGVDKVEFVVYEDKLRGDVKIQCVPFELGSFKFRHAAGIPSDWRGKPAEELKGIHPGLEFVHATGFLAACDTISSAREILELIP